jgi:hypothetical protein
VDFKAGLERILAPINVRKLKKTEADQFFDNPQTERAAQFISKILTH